MLLFLISFYVQSFGIDFGLYTNTLATDILDIYFLKWLHSIASFSSERTQTKKARGKAKCIWVDLKPFKQDK